MRLVYERCTCLSVILGNRVLDLVVHFDVLGNLNSLFTLVFKLCVIKHASNAFPYCHNSISFLFFPVHTEVLIVMATKHPDVIASGQSLFFTKLLVNFCV